jgi:hypothetical protein
MLFNQSINPIRFNASMPQSVTHPRSTQADLEGDEVADLERGVCADGGDVAAGFVAEDQRFSDDDVLNSHSVPGDKSRGAIAGTTDSHIPLRTASLGTPTLRLAQGQGPTVCRIVRVATLIYYAIPINSMGPY